MNKINEEDLIIKLKMQDKAIKLLNSKINYQKGVIRELKNKLLDTRRILRKYKKKCQEGVSNDKN